MQCIYRVLNKQDAPLIQKLKILGAKLTTYKLQVQDDDAKPDAWRDVKSESGKLQTFTDEAAARKALLEQFPVLVKLEQFASGPKRTRVVIVGAFQDIDDEKDE